MAGGNESQGGEMARCRHLALGAFLVIAMTLAACGGSSDSIPSNAVAVVDGQPITKAEYRHWITVTAKSTALPGTSSAVPDPPSYVKCIASLRKRSKPTKGNPVPSNAIFKTQCKQQYEQLMEQTIGTLIQNKWITEAGKEQRISVSNTDIQKAAETTKKAVEESARRSFKTNKAYQRWYLKQSGMTQANNLFRLRIQAIGLKLEAKFQKIAQDSVKPVSTQAIEKYYEEHKHKYWTPETRDTEYIGAASQKRADEALAAVKGGMSWAKAVKKYSTAPDTPTIDGISASQHEHRLDLVFRAKQGEVVGPTKDSFGWSIYRVTAIRAANEQPLQAVRTEIHQRLNDERESQISANFKKELTDDFQKGWKDKTNCRSGYIVQLCKNAPAPKATPAAGSSVATPPSMQGGTPKE